MQNNDSIPKPLKRASEVYLAKKIHDNLKTKYGGNFIFSEGSFWIYESNYWKIFDETEIDLAIHNLDGQLYGSIENPRFLSLSNNKVTGIKKLLEKICIKKNFFEDKSNGVNCLNGFIEFDTNGNYKISKHKPEHAQRFIINASFDSKVTYKGLNESYLKRLFNGSFQNDIDAEDKINLIFEIAGIACLGIGTKLKSPKAIIFVGTSAGNGKSQIIKILRSLIPNEARTSISPSIFPNQNYLAELCGKTLNTYDELKTSALESDIFKNVITGETVMAAKKFKDPIQFRPKAIHVFSTNTLPQFTAGIDEGVKRRIQILSFERTIPEAERIENISDLIIKNELSILLSLAVKGAQRIIKQGKLTVPQSSTEIQNEWVKHSDMVRAWYEEQCEDSEGSRVSKNEAYSAFIHWADHNGYRNRPNESQLTQRLRNVAPNYKEYRTSTTRFHEGFKLKKNCEVPLKP